MISINGKVLSNEDVIKMLESETGSGKMKADVEFCLLENYESSIKTLNELGEARYVKKFQATYAIVNQYDRRNFKEGGTETILYYTNVIKGGNAQPDRYLTNDLNKIVFHHGHLTVRAGQEDLLLFMRLNERCKTNKYWEETDARGNQKHTPQGAFNYKEIIPERVAEEDYSIYYDGLLAQAAVVNEKRIPYEKAEKMATSYGMVDARYKGEKAIRLFLATQAKANPEKFLADLESASFEIRAEVNSAFNYGIVKWDMPYIKWTKQSDGDNRICTVPSGKDHVDYFTFWLREIDRSGVLDSIRGSLEKAVLKDHGIQIKEDDKVYDAFLKTLGVTSLEEATALVAKAKTSAEPKPVPAELAEIVYNLGKYDADMLKKLGLDSLRQLGKYLEVRSSHVMGVDKLAEAIVEKNKLAVAA